MNTLSKESKEKIKNGNNEPIGKLFLAHFDFCVEHLSKTPACDQTLAEDVFMDALQVMRDKVISEDFEHDNLRGFLLVTAKNKLRNRLKRDQRTVSLDVNQVDTYLYHKKIMQNANSLLSEDQENRVDLILAARKQLGEACRKLLEWHFDKGYKLKDMVEVLAYTNYDSLKSSKYKCIKQLKIKVDQMMKQEFKEKRS